MHLVETIPQHIMSSPIGGNAEYIMCGLCSLLFVGCGSNALPCLPLHLDGPGVKL